MPAMRSKTFQIPLSREPKMNDIILLYDTYDNSVSIYHSRYDGSDWSMFGDGNSIASTSYSGNVFTFSVVYITGHNPAKATYVTGWEDS